MSNTPVLASGLVFFCVSLCSLWLDLSLPLQIGGLAVDIVPW